MGFLRVVSPERQKITLRRDFVYRIDLKKIRKKRGSNHKSESLSLVHSDVCGPLPTMSLGGASYFVTFIDDYSSRKVWVYPLRRKDDVLSVFQKFVTLVENQSGKKVKCLCSNNGGEYVSRAFQ